MDPEEYVDETPANPNNYLEVKHINAQCLKNKIGHLQFTSEGYDIMTISAESWLDDGISNEELALEGLQDIFRKD